LIALRTGNLPLYTIKLTVVKEQLSRFQHECTCYSISDLNSQLRSATTACMSSGHEKCHHFMSEFTEIFMGALSTARGGLI